MRFKWYQKLINFFLWNNPAKASSRLRELFEVSFKTRNWTLRALNSHFLIVMQHGEVHRDVRCRGKSHHLFNIREKSEFLSNWLTFYKSNMLWYKYFAAPKMKSLKAAGGVWTHVYVRFSVVYRSRLLRGGFWSQRVFKMDSASNYYHANTTEKNDSCCCGFWKAPRIKNTKIFSAKNCK